MSSKKLNVVVAGGSLGGLLHGIVLKRAGHNVTILERNLTTSMSSIGAGLSCSPEMTSFMSEYDLTSAPYFIQTHGMRFLLKDNTMDDSKTFAAYQQKATNWNTLYYRLRANFDGFKSPYCDVPAGTEGDGSAKYCDGCTVENVVYQERGDAVVVVYQGSKGEEQKIQGDLLIATDGPSSRVRKIFRPDVDRNYVGYVGWRGTVPESEISDSSREILKDSALICAIGNSQSISYLIPGLNGTLREGYRVYNWVWYRHYAFLSPSYNALMTDAHTSTPHRYTVPAGHVQQTHITTLRDDADQYLAASVAEMIRKTKQPFISAITDLVSPKAIFCNGKVLLAGDALATLRPQSALGVNASARSAMMLLQVLEGKMDLGRWEEEAVGFARRAREQGIVHTKMFGLRTTAEEAAEAEEVWKIKM